MSGNWKFPTGHIGDEPSFSDETEVEGAKRELVEELGITKPNNFIDTGIAFNFLQTHSNPIRAGEVREFVFATDISNQEINIDKNEFSEYKVYSFEEAISLMKFTESKDALIKVNNLLSDLQ